MTEIIKILHELSSNRTVDLNTPEELNFELGYQRAIADIIERLPR